MSEIEIARQLVKEKKFGEAESKYLSILDRDIKATDLTEKGKNELESCIL